jgi:hypothetical protein
MKTLLILSFFIQITVFCQKESVILKKEHQNSFFGNIAGLSCGNIDYTLVCNRIEVNGRNDFTVDGFKIQYGQKELEIIGNYLPDSLCEEIRTCCSYNSMIFLTNITAKHIPDGKQVFLAPFNLTIIRND